jgi:hypothetical protein
MWEKQLNVPIYLFNLFLLLLFGFLWY